MDERELVHWLEEQLGTRIPRHLIELLRIDGYLNVQSEEELEDALGRTRRLLQWNPGPGRTQRGPSEGALQRLANLEVLRRDAVSEHWAGDAARQPEVKRFRREVLDGRLLTHTEAVAFLTSAAAAMFGTQELIEAGVDPARHSAKIADESIEGIGGAYRAIVEVDGQVARLPFEGASTSGSVWLAGRPSGDLQFKARIDGTARDVQCWTGSALEDLLKVSASLDERGYPWQIAEAPMFVLTGNAPSVPALGHRLNWTMSSRGARAVITIDVEPWISVERVAQLYKVLQTHILGGRNRPISERRIALFRFITNRVDDDGNIPPWRQLMSEWNKEQSNWRYGNVRNFSRDYWAGGRAIVFPKYNPMWSVEKKNVEARKRRRKHP